MSLERIYLNRRKKSIEGMLMQKEKFCQWFENDKRLLNTKITMRELNKFVGADFEIFEINNEKIIKQGN